MNNTPGSGLKDGSYVALTKCHTCGADLELLIHKRLGDISELHRKAIPGRVCDSCNAHLKAGNTILISVRNGEKGDNPYRTGKICVMTPQGATRLFKGKPHPVAYIEDDLWDMLGLPKGDEDYSEPSPVVANHPAAVCDACGTWRKVRDEWKTQRDRSKIRARCKKCESTDIKEQDQLFPHTLHIYGQPTDKDSTVSSKSEGQSDAAENVSAAGGGILTSQDPGQGPGVGSGGGLLESTQSSSEASADPVGSGPGGVESSDGRG